MVKLNPEELIDRSPVSREQVLAMLVCTLLSSVEGFDMQALAFAAPQIAREWAIPSTMLGPVFSASLVGCIIGGIFIGPLGDRFGPKRILLLGTAAYSVLTLATIFSSNIAELLILRVLAGIGFGAALPGILSLLASISPRRLRAGVITAGTCAQMVGAIIGGALSAELMPAYGWQSVFLLGGVAPLIILPFGFRLVPESMAYLSRRPDAERTIRQALAKLGKAGDLTMRIDPAQHIQQPKMFLLDVFADGRGLATAMLGFAAFMGTMHVYFMTNWVPSILAGSRVSLRFAVMGGVVLNLGGLIGAACLSSLTNKIKPYHVVSIAFVAAAFILAAIPMHHATGGLLVGLILLAGACGLGAQFCMTIILISFYPARLHNTAVGFATGVSRGGGVCGPLLGSALLAAGVPIENLFYFVAIMVALAAAGISAMYICSRSVVVQSNI